jgi:hypothetical protein
VPTSEKDVEKLSTTVQKKRDQLQELRRKRVAQEQGLTNEITVAQLSAEEARLDAEIAAEKDRASVASVKSGASTTLEQAQAEMQAAVDRQKAEEQLRTADAQAAKDATKNEKEQ